jgi:CheY-like chemotaxis protein
MSAQSLDDPFRVVALFDTHHGPKAVVNHTEARHLLVEEVHAMADKSTLKILVVDDNLLVLTTVCRMLKALGCEATGTGDGMEALSRFAQEDFDLVLTDLQMPRMDGWVLARRIKSLAPGVPVIAMTGLRGREVLDRPGESSLDRVLYKPLNLGQLDNAMAAALKSRPLKFPRT